MATSRILQHLYSLNTTSPDLLPNLYRLIQNDDKEQYLSGLQGADLIRLVDFLEEALDVIPVTNDIYRRCLHRLQTICNLCRTLPSSYNVSGNLARIGGHPIAYGGFSDVWEGTHNGKKVCIKCLRITERDRQNVEKRFCKEAVMWKRLKHRNIVALIGVTQDPLQFVSEWMPNGTLTEYLEENPGADRIRLLLDVAEGLAFLHANHTTHGDLKGPNILIDHDGHARLTDFGFASVVRGLNSVHITKVQGYTTNWAAPEVLRDGDKITREADVFAFGMVVIEAFTGMPPFHELSDSATIMKIVGGERPRRPRMPNLTDLIWNMTCGCWFQEPTGRPTMTQVVKILRGCLAPPVLVEGMNNTKNFVSVAHISMDWELASVDDSVSPVMHNTRPRELVNRLFAPIDLTDAPSASRYSAGYHNQQGQKTGSRLYPGDPALFPYPPAPLAQNIYLPCGTDPQGVRKPHFYPGVDLNQVASCPQVAKLLALSPLPSPRTRGQIVIPQRPYLPHHRQSHLVNFISEDPVTFLQYTGVGGIPLMYAINKSFFGLIGRDDAMFANYAGPTISLRLEWPGYKSWTGEIGTKGRKGDPRPITKSELAYKVAKKVQDFMAENAREPMISGTERWQVGPGFIEVKDLVLSRMIHVSKGSWQAEFLMFE